MGIPNKQQYFYLCRKGFGAVRRLSHRCRSHESNVAKEDFQKCFHFSINLTSSRYFPETFRQILTNVQFDSFSLSDIRSKFQQWLIFKVEETYSSSSTNQRKLIACFVTTNVQVIFTSVKIFFFFTLGTSNAN